MPEVLAAVSPKSRPTYGKGLRALEHSFGDLPLDEVRLTHLTRLRDEMRREVGEAKVNRARRTGRQLRAYDPDAHGKGAAENTVRALRFFFRYAHDAGLIQVSPALGLQAPRRPPAPERALEEHELTAIWIAGVGTSRDPELDELLLSTLRHTAARREGTINLCLGHLDLAERAISLTEKNGETRRLPLTAALLTSLDAFARTRGATQPHDAVLRYRDGRALTRRHFNSLFDRIDRHLGWTEPLDVGAHWIRHTTLTDIAAVSGIRVAAAFAGHAPSSVGVIGRYVQVTFGDLADAYEAVFGPRG
jgi:site-specific recombinase XerD